MYLLAIKEIDSFVMVDLCEINVMISLLNFIPFFNVVKFCNKASTDIIRIIINLHLIVMGLSGKSPGFVWLV